MTLPSAKPYGSAEGFCLSENRAVQSLLPPGKAANLAVKHLRKNSKDNPKQAVGQTNLSKQLQRHPGVIPDMQSKLQIQRPAGQKLRPRNDRSSDQTAPEQPQPLRQQRPQPAQHQKQASAQKHHRPMGIAAPQDFKEPINPAAQ